jgi:3-hydroxyacyl-CoA dehydrogenase / enoyl-CoA hydratase / 3-hydroxybutyryl-CoA epimerase
VHPYSIERAATQAGYPVGPLQLADELNLELMVKIAKTTREALGSDEPTTTERVAGKLIAAGRSGKLKGAGFYEYVDPSTGSGQAAQRTSIWEGLAELFPISDQQPAIADLRDRQMFIEAIETAKTFEEGVVTSAAHANIGSVFGIGFPPATGGAAQFITGYDAADGSFGIEAFLKRADELAAAYGERFAPTPYLRELAAKGESFPA